MVKDIPIFQTEYGVASLVLSQVSLRREAYVRFQAVGRLAPLVEECASFCHACGAERVYGVGAEGLERYPLETAIYTMEGRRSALPETQAYARPVGMEERAAWREIYNSRMAAVPHAALLRAWGEALPPGACYFVCRGDTLLGIGAVMGSSLLTVASVEKGSGAELVAALAKTMPKDAVRLEVASANWRAIRLYRRLGFVQTGELERWYEIG